MENQHLFEDYRKGVLEGVKDCSLLQNEPNENGFTESEFARIKNKIENADFQLRLGYADAEIKGYSDGFEIEALNIYSNRGDTVKKVVLSDLFEKYKAMIPQLQIKKPKTENDMSDEKSLFTSYLNQAKANLLSAMRVHEQADHDGLVCINERVNSIARLCHALGMKQENIKQIGEILADYDKRCEENRATRTQLRVLKAEIISSTGLKLKIFDETKQEITCDECSFNEFTFIQTDFVVCLDCGKPQPYELVWQDGWIEVKEKI